MIQIGSKKASYYKGLLEHADSKLHEQIASSVGKLIERGGRLLDLGAGQGAMSKRLLDLGYQVVAADSDQKNFMCDDAVFYKIDFNKPDEVKLLENKYSNYFDAVLGIEVIEHVENPWEYVRLLKKLLKPDGYLFITTPNISSWLSRFVFLFTGQFVSFNDKTYSEYGHISPISEWELTKILESEKFREIKIMPGGTLPAIWITRNLLFVISNILSFFIRPFMRGLISGWCIIVIAKKGLSQ